MRSETLRLVKGCEVKWAGPDEAPAGSPGAYLGWVVTDGELVDAFTSLRPLLFSVAYRMLGLASDAEDVVQDAWLRYAASAREIRDPARGSSASSPG